MRDSRTGWLLLALFIGAASELSGCDSGKKAVELARGQTIVLGTWTWDVESNRQAGNLKSPVADVWWRHATDKNQFLVPIGEAGLAMLGQKEFDKVTYRDLAGAPYSGGNIANALLVPGTVIALRTSEGNFAKLKVIGYRALHDFTFPEAELLQEGWRAYVLKSPNQKNYHLEVEWVLYEKE